MDDEGGPRRGGGKFSRLRVHRTSWVGGAAAGVTFFGIPGIRWMFGWRTDGGRRTPLRMTRPADGAARWNY